jgi:hypothetical protein
VEEKIEQKQVEVNEQEKSTERNNEKKQVPSNNEEKSDDVNKEEKLESIDIVTSATIESTKKSSTLSEDNTQEMKIVSPTKADDYVEVEEYKEDNRVCGTGGLVTDESNNMSYGSPYGSPYDTPHVPEQHLKHSFNYDDTVDVAHQSYY